MDKYSRSPEEEAASLQRAKDIKAKEALEEYRKSIKNAKNALIFIGAIEILVAFFYYFKYNQEMMFLAIDGLIGAVFIGLYFLSKQYLKESLIAGLIIYLSFHLIIAALDPTSIIKGIIIKIIIITTLIAGIKAVTKIPPSLNKKDDDEILDVL